MGVDSFGFSGGLLLLWKLQIHMKIIDQSRNWIIGEISLPNMNQT